MTETHEVLRTINAGEKKYQPGEKVDASNWRWRDRLVEMRMMRPLPVVIAAQIEQPKSASGKVTNGK